MLARLDHLGTLTLSTPARAVCLLTLYLALHALARLWVLPDGLGYDDAEQVLSAQTWALTYRFEQPPLVTWLLKLVGMAIGGPPDLLALTLLRTCMLAALYVVTYLVARQWLHDYLQSAVAATSLAATYTLGWLAHGDLPHSTLLAVMVVLALWLWGRLLARPSLGRTVAFGLACGLGLLAKWNFALLAAGVLIMALLDANGRRLVLTWRTPLILALAALVAAPTVIAVAAGGMALEDVATGVLNDGAERSLATLGAGALSLATSVIAFPQPWLVVALLVLGPAMARPTPPIGRLLMLVLVVLALHAALIPLAGASSFPERWMIVPLLPLPILVLAAVAPGARRVRALGGAVVVIAMVVLGLRVGIAATDGAYCGKCRTRIPAEAFAAALVEAGFETGTIVVSDMHLGGNLERHLPEARLVALGFPPGAWPAPGAGQCVVAWPEGANGRSILRKAATALDADLDGLPTRVAQAPILGNPERTQAMRFRLGAGQGRCR